ncbi:MAG TPA: hypothetical protein VGQ44_17235 [Gemmatimonadaceae bacterium]|jgi:hypothetical protein|nr:hypothetical protein [Gemmatimonadaceae bacterium]
MTGFADAIRSFGLKVKAQSENVVAGSAIEVLRSIKTGSELTGAPGQPVDTARLLNSWQLEQLSRLLWSVSTNVEYAPPIEEGVGRFGPLTLRSQVGGFHSVASTRANFDRIVAYVTPRVQGGTP